MKTINIFKGLQLKAIDNYIIGLFYNKKIIKQWDNVNAYSELTLINSAMELKKSFKKLYFKEMVSVELKSNNDIIDFNSICKDSLDCRYKAKFSILLDSYNYRFIEL